MLKSFIAGILALFAATFGIHHAPLATTPTSVAPTSSVITVVNDYFKDPITLVTGTRFETTNGQIFRAPEPIVVPGKHGSLNGTIDITISADAAGQSPAGRLTLPGLASSPKMYEHVFALTAAHTPTNDTQAASAAAAINSSNNTTPHIQDLSNRGTPASTGTSTTSGSSGTTISQPSHNRTISATLNRSTREPVSRLRHERGHRVRNRRARCEIPIATRRNQHGQSIGAGRAAKRDRPNQPDKQSLQRHD
jgi:hypothetical protein